MMGILTNFLMVLRASNPDFVRGVQDAIVDVANTLPTSGDDGRSGAWSATFISSKEQRRQALEAERNDVPYKFNGL